MTHVNKALDPSLLWQDPSQSSASGDAQNAQGSSPQISGQLPNFSPVAASGTQSGGAVDSVGRSGVANRVTAGAQAFGHQNPVLPDAKDASGKAAQFSPENRQKALNVLQSNLPADGSSVSQAEIFNILDKTAQASFVLASKLQRASSQASIQAKEAEVKDQKAEIEGEKKSAQIQLAGSILGALFTGAAGIGGSKMSLSGGKIFSKRARDEKDAAAKRAEAEQKGAQESKFVVQQEEASEVSGASKEVSRNSQRKKASESLEKAKESGLEKKSEAEEASAGSSNKTRTSEESDRSTPPGEDLNQQKVGDSNQSTASVSSSTTQSSEKPDKGFFGSIKSALNNKQALGSGLQAGANAFGQVVTQSFSLGDKMSGGQHEADQAKVDQKVDQVMAQIAQANQESSKANRDQVTEFIKTIMQMVQSGTQRHQDMMNQIGNR